MAVSVGHQLVGFLAGRIKTHRVIHALVLGKRQIGVTAVHRAAGGIHQVIDAVVTAALEDVAKAHEVALDVGRWVIDRVAHSRLGRQVHHLAGLVGFERRFHRLAVFQICLNQLKATACALSGGLQLRDPRPLQKGVVVGVQIVKSHHRRAPLKESLTQVKANEAGSAGNQNGHTDRERSKLGTERAHFT